MVCVDELSAATHSRARAAWACGSSDGFVSHTMSGAMPPVLAIAAWLAVESLAKMEIVISTRTARSTPLALAEPRSPTMRLAISARLSTCLAASAASAPATHCCDLSVLPETSNPSNGSMPPSLAIVSLLAAFSVANAQMADAPRSLASVDPSRTSVHNGVTAPVRAMAVWLAVWLRDRLASAPAAEACSCGEGEASIPTSGGMAPASAIASWFCGLPFASSLTAEAARVFRWRSACGARSEHCAEGRAWLDGGWLGPPWSGDKATRRGTLMYFNAPYLLLLDARLRKHEQHRDQLGDASDL